MNHNEENLSFFCDILDNFNDRSIKENAISKDNFYLEHKTDKNEYLGNVNKPMSNKDSNLDTLMLNSKPSPKNTNNEKNIGKQTLSKRIGDNTAEFVPSENEQLRFKKEVGKYDTKDPLTGSYSFGFKTQNQYREEERTADGTVRGNFGWVDDTGKWHHTIFISDEYGYRINTPENIINSHHPSNIPAASLTSATKKESTYVSYNNENEASYKRKVTRIEPSRNEQKNDSGLPQKKYPEEPLLINLKQKLGIKPPVVSSDSTKQKDDDNSTYLSYVKAEANLNQNETSKTPPHDTELLVSNVTPTKIPAKVKPTTHETITVTNLQDNFFNKLPLKPQKENVPPPLDKPFKMFSNYLTKWPNMSWPKPSDPELEKILGNLQGLSGRSNSFTDSELNFQADYSTLDESKMAKSIYDSPLNKNFNKDKKTEHVKRTRSETSNRSPYLYSFGNTQRSDNFNPYFVDTPKSIGYNSPSLQIVPYKQNSMYLPYNHDVFDKTLVLIIPVFYAWYPLIHVQNMNLANPNLFHNQFMNPVQPPNYVNALNDMQDLSPSHNLQNLIDSSNEKEKDESQEDDEDSKDYLLLSNEFQEINGSITNDPAFGNIQDFFSGTNDSKFLQNITFEKPIEHT
ncbi:hypothetical protein Avbf_08683 [Armadillidium vulgare]|nr:hypothetical protein Avbf_08683 [Armadillidium vulgare]